MTAGDVIGYMGHTGYSTTENVNNIEVTHLHWGLELVFDEEQKESDNEIWIDVYPLTCFLAKHTQEVQKVEGTREWIRTTKNPGILISKNFILLFCYFFLTKALQNRFRYVKMGTVK